jgi:hypothetical protein
VNKTYEQKSTEEEGRRQAASSTEEASGAADARRGAVEAKDHGRGAKMTAQRKPGEHARQAIISALKKLPRNRAYALTPETELALGAIAEAWRESKKYDRLFSIDLADLVERLAAFDFLELVQQRAAEPEKLAWPVDDVTGERLPNPWLSDGNLGARNLVNKLSPALARHMERAAKGEQWQAYVEGLQQIAERAELNAIQYGEAEHKSNVFRTGSLEEQGKFVKEKSPEFPRESLLVAFYRREAQEVRLPWSASTINRYRLGMMKKADAELGDLATAATGIEQRWLEEQRQIVREEEAAAKRRLEAIQARLGHGPTPSEEQRRAELAHLAAQR